MYGTIAKLKAKPGALEALKGMAGRDEAPPGAVAVFVFQMDANPNEFFVVAVSESEEAYRAYSESPESHQRYLELTKYLDGEPEWHDGQVVHHQLR